VKSLGQAPKRFTPAQVEIWDEFNEDFPWLGRSDRRVVGLAVIEKRERSVPKLSLLDTREDSFGTKSERGYTYQIPPESWQNMVEMLERRGSFDIDAAISRASCHFAPDPSPRGSSFDALAMAAAAPQRANQRHNVVSLPDIRQDVERPPQRLVRAGGGP